MTIKISKAGKKDITVETIEVVSGDPKRPKVVLSLQASRSWTFTCTGAG
jgi:hypothetical protein